MKKRLLTLLFALMMTLSLIACGGGDDKAPVSVESGNSLETSADSGDESLDNSGDEIAEDSAIDISGWSCYMGVMDDDSTIYYAFDETGTRGALMFLSPDYTSSISVIGDSDFDEESGIEYITDDATGLTIGYAVADNGDGSYSLDLGNLGSAIVAEADPQEVLNAMDTIAEGTTDVTQDFINSLE